MLRNTILKLYVPLNTVKPSGHCKLTVVIGVSNPYSYIVVTVVTMNTVRSVKAIMSSASHLPCIARRPPGHLAGHPPIFCRQCISVPCVHVRKIFDYFPVGLFTN